MVFLFVSFFPFTTTLPITLSTAITSYTLILYVGQDAVISAFILLPVLM